MRGTTLLTGATGFVGGELLRRLAQGDEPVVCLVRADSLAKADARGEETLRRLAVPRDRWDRVRWVPGDVLSPRLGLSRARFRALAGEVAEIYHCAASTSFDLPLEEAYAINVQGVRRVVGLADIARKQGVAFRRLHHVSTAYVAGLTPGSAGADHLPPDDPSLFRNTYERTKAMAERFLHTQMDRLPISIYRPSIVVGDSQTGYTSNWNVVYFPMRLVSAGKLPYVPAGGKALLDCVPVDYVADAILALGARPESLGQTYNLSAGDDALTVQDVVRHTFAGMQRKGQALPARRTKALRPFAWGCLKAFTRLTAGPKLRKAMDGFAVYESYCMVDTVLDSTAEREELARLGVAWLPSERFFATVTDYALERRFGKKTAQAKAPRRAPRRASARLAEALQSASGALAEALQSGTGTLGSVGA